MQYTALATTGEPLEGAAFERPCYRIPAMAVTGTGRVVVAYDVRADWRDLPGPFDLVYRTSDDSGRTWGPTRVLRRHHDNQGYGDASFIVDTSTGRLWMFHVSSRGANFFDATDGTGPDDHILQLELSWSDDDGEMWQHRTVTPELKAAGVHGAFFSSGHGIQLQEGAYAGRLLQPMVVRRADGQHFAVTAYSDDHGDTWHLGELVGPQCDENKVVELADGLVAIFARDKPRRRVAYSTDGGRSFSEPLPDEALVDPACNGGVTRIRRPGKPPLLITSLLNHPSERRDLVLRTSLDDGATWSDPVPLRDGPCAYSLVLPLADGGVGVAFEDGDYAAVAFVRLEANEIDPATRPLHPAPIAEPNPGGSSGAAKPPEVATAD